MEVIKAKILPSKSISLSKSVFANKMENSVTKIVFEEIEENANLLNKYVSIFSPNGEAFLIPLNPEDNSFIVTYDITRIDGSYTMLYISTNSQFNLETGELVDPNFKTYVSNQTTFKINSNFLNEENLQEPEVDPNILNIWETMNQTVVFLNSEEFKQELIDSLHLSAEDIETIINNLKNDEEFKEEIKGEKGEDGKSIYEEWLNQNKYIDGESINSNLKFYINKDELDSIKIEANGYYNNTLFQTTTSKFSLKIRGEEVTLERFLNNGTEAIETYTEEQMIEGINFPNNDYVVANILNVDYILLKEKYLNVEEFSNLYLRGEQGEDAKSTYEIYVEDRIFKENEPYTSSTNIYIDEIVATKVIEDNIRFLEVFKSDKVKFLYIPDSTTEAYIYKYWIDTEVTEENFFGSRLDRFNLYEFITDTTKYINDVDSTYVVSNPLGLFIKYHPISPEEYSSLYLRGKLTEEEKEEMIDILKDYIDTELLGGVS